MGLRINKSLILLIGLVSLLAVTGCAQRKALVAKESVVASQAAPSIKSIKVLDEGAKLEILLDQPVTYTFYKVNEPLKAVIDLAQTGIADVNAAVEIDKGLLKRYELTKQDFGAGSLARLEVFLKNDGEFSVVVDPNDKAKLVAIFSGKQVVEAIQSKPVAAAVEVAPASDVAVKAAVPTPIPESAPSPSVSEKAPDVNAAVVEPKAIIPTLAETSLTVITVNGDAVELALNGNLSNYNAFKLSKPERLVVDLFGVKNSLATNVTQVNAFGINQARLGVTADKLRIVFDSATGEIPPYHLEKTDAGIRLTFDKSQALAAETAKPSLANTAPTETAAEKVTPVAVTMAATTKEIESIDFKLVNGYSQIAIRSGKDCRPGKLVKTSDGLSLTIKNCQIPRNLQRYIDTSSFASVVKGITPVPVKSTKGVDARLLVKLRAEAPYRIKQDGNMTYWEIKNTEVPSDAEKMASTHAAKANSQQVKAEEKELGEVVLAKGQGGNIRQAESKKTYSGRKVTLEFSDADVRKIFQLIAEVSNLNFLIGDDVTGTISIKLVNVPWDQALDVILETKQLAMKRDGNIVQIMQKSKMLSQEQEEKNAKDALEMAMPLKTVIFDINYAKIDDIEKQFTALKSKRGMISKDSRTNRIIIKDIEPAVEDMKFLLKSMDLPERQVMIEARIVEASANFTRDLGVKWTVGYKDGSASFANINSVDSSFGGVVSNILPTTTTGGLATGMSFGKLTNNVQLDMRLSAAATIGQVKVISTPKVLTLNNKKAKISQGQSVPYQTVSAEGTKTEFIEAVLTLEVTPHITSDGSVGMEVKASNNSVGAGTPPPINKKEATTELVVKNGETTVIGGIYIDSDTDTETGVPFLMDIPLLGWMFKSNSKAKNKTELLIFITPKIIN